MRRAHEVDPLPRASITAELGWLYWGAGRLAEATDEARKSLEADPDLLTGLYVLGAVHAEKGLYEEAIAAHERVAAISPAWSWALASTYAQAGRAEEAREILVASLELAKTGDPWVAWGLAEVYAALGEEGGSIPVAGSGVRESA